MKQKLVLFFSALFVLLNPATLLAQEGGAAVYDARLEGYKVEVTLVTKTPMLMWPLLIVLAGLCLGVLFKNANRSPVD